MQMAWKRKDVKRAIKGSYVVPMELTEAPKIEMPAFELTPDPQTAVFARPDPAGPILPVMAPREPRSVADIMGNGSGTNGAAVNGAGTNGSTGNHG
jgi:hypothetical protein